MTPALFAGLFFHFMLLSLIAIGGFMATLPGMYSYLVDTAGLLTPETFAKTVAFGQSLPGPNVLVAAVLGWAAAGPLGALATFGGTSFLREGIFASTLPRFSLSPIKPAWRRLPSGFYLPLLIFFWETSLITGMCGPGPAPSQLLFGKPIFPSFF